MATSICSKEWKSIGGFSVLDCRPTIPGCAGRAWLFDKEVFSTYTLTWNTSTNPAMNNQYIQKIVVPTGTDKGLRLESFGMPYDGAVTLTDDTYFMKIGHQVTVRAYQKSFRAKELIDSLVYAPCVLVLENLDDGADIEDTTLGTHKGLTKFEVYGLDTGLRLTGISASTNLTNEAAFELTFGTDNDLSEDSMPVSILNWESSDTDWHAVVVKTRNMLDGITQANPTGGESYAFEGARKKYFGSLGVSTFTPSIDSSSNGRGDSRSNGVSSKA